MIILSSFRLVVITPPKCGSTSATHRWTQPDVSGVLCIGPQADGRIDKHTTVIPYDAYEYRVVSLTREPYTRALSLYQHYLEYDDASATLDQFIDVLVSRRHPFAWPINEIPGIDQASERWPIETIDTIAKSYCLPPLPRFNATHAQHAMTPSQRHSLTDWADA